MGAYTSRDSQHPGRGLRSTTLAVKTDDARRAAAANSICDVSRSAGRPVMYVAASARVRSTRAVLGADDARELASHRRLVGHGDLNVP
jgi:hypothetical protein